MAIEKTTKLSGGLTGYYLAEVKHPQREEQVPYVAEMEDISAVLKFTPEEFNIVKSIWRTAADRLGYGKPGANPIYDAEKVVHSATRRLRLMKQELSAEGETEFKPKLHTGVAIHEAIQPMYKEGVWYTNTGKPIGIDPDTLIEYVSTDEGVENIFTACFRYIDDGSWYPPEVNSGGEFYIEKWRIVQ